MRLRDKFYVGLLSGTDVGRLLTRTIPSAIWVGRLGIITDQPYTPDFELAINFDARTLKSHNPDDMASLTDADEIVFRTFDTGTDNLIIDGEFNDRGIIYGTTTFSRKTNGNPDIVHAGILTGLIGEKGAAAVFYSSTTLKYAGGLSLCQTGGEGGTIVRINTPTSFNVWDDWY